MNSKKSTISVLIVDDSALIRALLQEVLESDPRMNVIACAKDAFEARDLIKLHHPDVITLDIEMPKMNGITFLKNLMRLRPMPVVMISTLTQEGAPATLQALELGAVDFVPKPKSDREGSLEESRELIIEKVANAARAHVRAVQDQPTQVQLKSYSTSNASLVKSKQLKHNFLVAIGASTGGTEAIKEVITALPENSPPIVVVQHIPETFSRSYAARVDSYSAVKVYEAEHHQLIVPGSVYIAPGNMHLRVVFTPKGYMCVLDEKDLVNRHRPSVEVLYDSVIDAAKDNSMGVLLTGMGADGAEALLRMKEAKCLTIAQDEATSVVWGMPGAAVGLGAAEKVLPLDSIASAILSASFK